MFMAGAGWEVKMVGGGTARHSLGASGQFVFLGMTD
jgi:hypothetical protein